jgi:hypothetical protein
MPNNSIIYVSDADGWRVIRLNPLDFQVERHYEDTDHVDSARLSLAGTGRNHVRRLDIVAGTLHDQYQIPAAVYEAVWHSITHGLGIKL